MKFLRYQSTSGPAYGELDKDETTVYGLDGTPYGEHHRRASIGTIDGLTLLAPVQPRNIFCVGMNYADHVRETKAATPEFPLYFMKPQSALIGPNQPIVYPKDSSAVGYESEFVIVIGKSGRRIPKESALEHVLGYACGNDVSARDYQRKEMAQGFLMHGKGFDTFAPVGPVVVTDVDGSDLAIQGRVNGETRQRSRTSQLIFNVEYLVSDLSSFTTLHAGDIILTGTPAGVGLVKPGDVVEVEIEGIGILRNQYVAEE